jgi:SAM-dependent methyltransferase
MKASYDIESEVQSDHWWFAARRRILLNLLARLDHPLNGIALDLGCGTGSNLSILSRFCSAAAGVDGSLYALSLVRRKCTCPVINGDLRHLPVRSESVSLAVAMDVLEHLDDDAAGLKEIHRILKAGGVAFLTVPAFTFLWGLQDDVTGHKRRYSRKDLVKKITEAGFSVARISFFNFFLFFPILVGRKLVRLLKIQVKSENVINCSWANAIFKGIFCLEARLLSSVSFPWGVSILCLARKAGEDR